MQTRNDFLGQVDGPELFIGLVGAIGTNLPLVVEALSEELRELSYDPHEIHLSHLIRPIPEFKFLAGLDGGPQRSGFKSTWTRATHCEGTWGPATVSHCYP